MYPSSEDITLLIAITVVPLYNFPLLLILYAVADSNPWEAFQCILHYCKFILYQLQSTRPTPDNTVLLCVWVSIVQPVRQSVYSLYYT